MLSFALTYLQVLKSYVSAHSHIPIRPRITFFITTSSPLSLGGLDKQDRYTSDVYGLTWK